MSKLLRRLANAEKWAELADSSLLKSGDCPPDLLIQVYDNRDGVSVFEVDGEENILRAVSFHAFSSKKIGDYVFALIDREEIEKNGMNIVSTKGDTSDDLTNNYHRIITNISGKSLIKLVNIVLGSQIYTKTIEDIIGFFVVL